MDAATRSWIRAEISRRRVSELRLHRKNVDKRVGGKEEVPRPPQCPAKFDAAMISARVLFRELDKWLLDNHGIDTRNAANEFIAKRTGYSAKRLLDMRRQKKVSFDTADHIVTHINVWLWQDSKSMNRIYSRTDFRWWEPEFRREQDKKREVEYRRRSDRRKQLIVKSYGEVASRCGTSRVSVHRVLNGKGKGKVGEDLQKRILATWNQIMEEAA